jgi:hypothetical protein
MVSECAAGMVHTRRQVGVVLERLAQAPAEDLGRMDRALQGFHGLNALDYYRACQLALWTEADRVKHGRELISQVIGQKVAKAVEQNVPPDLHVGGESGWEPFVLSRVPLLEGLRIAQVASDKKDVAALLWSFHPEGHPDATWGESPTHAGARRAIQQKDRRSLRSWVNRASVNEETKDRGLSVLVPVLAEAGRLEEALEYLNEIGSRLIRDAATLDGIRLCAGAERETEASTLLSRLTFGLNWVKGRVELIRTRLRVSGDVDAAVAEMEAIEAEVASRQGRGVCDEETSQMTLLNRGFSGVVDAALSDGWANVVWAWIDFGQLWKALNAAKHVFHVGRRTNCIKAILVEAERRVTSDEALMLAQAVLHAAADYGSFDHTEFVLRCVIEFLARSGSAAALQFALDLIEEKMAGSNSATREKHRQEALRMFASLPPSELSWEETAAVGNGISSAATRADCLYALALHAALEDEWDQCEDLERRAERILETADQEDTSAQPSGGFGEVEEKPGIPEMLRWIRSRQHSEEVQSEPRQWFSEAIALAVSLRHFPLDALYAVGRLLIESPPFPGREDLYQEAWKKMEWVASFFDASLFRNELNRRAESALWDPTKPALPELDQSRQANQKTPTGESAGDLAAPHPRLFHKKFRSVLARIEQGNGLQRLISSFLQEAAPRILHPIRKPVVEALFEAARGVRCTLTITKFLSMVHALATEHGDTPGARWVAEAARDFAREAGVLPEYETELKTRLEIAPAGGAQPQESKLKEGDTAPGLNAAFADLEKAPDVRQAMNLFDKALATGDSQLVFRAFDLVEAGFAIETSHGQYSMVFESACEWPLKIGKLPSRADRIHLLRRMWNWYDWFQMQDGPEGIAFVPAWAGQMAAAGELDLAMETVKRLRSDEARANGYAELAVGCGLTRGDIRAEEIFARFVEAAKELAAKNEYQQGADLGVRRIAMVCAEEGDHQHLVEVVALGKEMLLSNKEGEAHYCLVNFLIDALSRANRTDVLGELLDCLVQSKQTTGWHSGQMLCVISSLWEACRDSPGAFTLPVRLNLLEKFSIMMAGVRPVQQWGASEAKLLQICLYQSQEIPQILDRFEAVSSCSPEVAESLLNERLDSCPDHSLPVGPDDRMLRWIANLCPYSDKTAIHLVQYVAIRCLYRNDWHSLIALARECHSLDLDWLKVLAEAVLASE